MMERYLRFCMMLHRRRRARYGLRRGRRLSAAQLRERRSAAEGVLLGAATSRTEAHSGYIGILLATAAPIAADVICRVRLYRKTGNHVNTEGRVQMANRADASPGAAREDWAILGESDVLARKLPRRPRSGLRKSLFKDGRKPDAHRQVRSRAGRRFRRLQARAAASKRRRFFQDARWSRGFLPDTIRLARASAVMAACRAASGQQCGRQRMSAT